MRSLGFLLLFVLGVVDAAVTYIMLGTGTIEEIERSCVMALLMNKVGVFSALSLKVSWQALLIALAEWGLRLRSRERRNSAETCTWLPVYVVTGMFVIILVGGSAHLFPFACD